MLTCQACRDPKSLFLGGWLRLWRAAGLPFGYPLDSFHFEWQGGGFSFWVLSGTTTENVFGDQVAGFTALLLCLSMFPVQISFLTELLVLCKLELVSCSIQVPLGGGGGDVWEGVQKLGPAAAASLAAVFVSGGSKIEDENFIATYFVLKHDPGTLGGC